MAAGRQNRHPGGNPFEERVLDKLESIDGRLRRIEGKAPAPSASRRPTGRRNWPPSPGVSPATGHVGARHAAPLWEIEG